MAMDPHSAATSGFKKALFTHLPMLPTDARAVTTWSNQDDRWLMWLLAFAQLLKILHI
jgi:hypothetical protein